MWVWNSQLASHKQTHIDIRDLFWPECLLKNRKLYIYKTAGKTSILYYNYSVMSMVFDNDNDVVQLVSAKLISMWMHNKTNSRNRGVVAYTVNSLMMVVATTETCQNMAWLYQCLELQSVWWCICWKLQTNHLYVIHRLTFLVEL
jgi:hypothetical protein